MNVIVGLLLKVEEEEDVNISLPVDCSSCHWRGGVGRRGPFVMVFS